MLLHFIKEFVSIKYIMTSIKPKDSVSCEQSITKLNSYEHRDEIQMEDIWGQESESRKERRKEV